MIHNSAKKLANLLSRKNIIELGKESIYSYGLELIISGFLGILLVVITSIFLGYPLLWIPFLVGYILFRTNAGGFHARNHHTCILSFLVLYVLLLLLFPFLHRIDFFPIIISVLNLLPIIKYAPLDVKNNPLFPDQRKKRRHSILILAICNIIISVIPTFLFHKCWSWITAYYLGVMAAGFLFSVAVIQEIIERRKHNETQIDSASF